MATPSFDRAGVSVDETAEDAVKAREQGFAVARRRAFDALAAEFGARPRRVTDARLEQVVTSMVIETERVSLRRYVATFTVRFDRGRTMALLGAQAPAAPRPRNPEPVERNEDEADTADAQPDSPRRRIRDVEVPPPPKEEPLPVWAGFRSGEEWFALRRRLFSSRVVTSMEVRAISGEAAALLIGLTTDDLDTVATVFRQEGLILRPGGDGPMRLWLAAP